MSIRNVAWLFIGFVTLAGCGNSESTDGLIGDLSSSDAKDRVGAVRELQNRKVDAAKVVPALMQSLKDKNVSVRLSAAIGLGGLGADAKDAIPDLEAAKKDRDRRVRDAASVAISRIEGKEKD